MYVSAIEKNFSPLIAVLRSGSTVHELTSLTVTQLEGEAGKEDDEEENEGRTEEEENEGQTENSCSSSSE